MSTPVAESRTAGGPRMGADDKQAPAGPASETDLKWRRKKMVRWLSPGQLTATAVRALLSGIFGSYADRREVQAALHQADRTDDPDPDCAPLHDLIYHYENRSDPEH